MEGSFELSLCFLALVLTAATDGHRIVFPVSVTLEEGDACTMHSGAPARCTDIRDCDYTNLNYRQDSPVRCGFKGIFPVVCCPAVPRDHLQPVMDIAPPTVTFQCGRNAKRNRFPNVRSQIYVNNVTVKLDSGTEAVYHLHEGAPGSVGPVSSAAGVGSVRAERNAWPWMALVGERNGKSMKWFCGGALINEEWVLSALHCFLYNKPEVVRLGEHDYKDSNDGAPHQDFPVTEMVMYPGYTHPAGYHDLALLRLASRVSIQKFISPVCLPWGVESEVDITGRKATLTGYGDTEFGGLPTPYLQELNVTVFPSAQCDRSYSNLPYYADIWPQGIGQETLCAGDPNGGRDACQGDSGGPLVSQDARGHFIVAGIVSQGHGCGHKDYPGLYANLRHPPYLTWIKKVAFTVS